MATSPTSHRQEPATLLSVDFRGKAKFFGWRFYKWHSDRGEIGMKSMRTTANGWIVWLLLQQVYGKEIWSYQRTRLFLPSCVRMCRAGDEKLTAELKGARIW